MLPVPPPRNPTSLRFLLNVSNYFARAEEKSAARSAHRTALYLYTRAACPPAGRRSPPAFRLVRKQAAAATEQLGRLPPVSRVDRATASPMDPSVSDPHPASLNIRGKLAEFLQIEFSRITIHPALRPLLEGVKYSFAPGVSGVPADVRRPIWRLSLRRPLLSEASAVLLSATIWWSFRSIEACDMRLFRCW